MPSVLALLLENFLVRIILTGTLVKSAEDQPGSAAGSQKSRGEPGMRGSTNGTRVKASAC